MSRVNYNFDVIGISEHKILKDTHPAVNINLEGYNEFIYEPTETTHGGTGFYIKNGVDYVKRDDLQINSPSNFESMFIELQFPKKKNLIVGCIYRHPSSILSVHDFTNTYLDPILQKISSENKQCVLMGDFNINLLKADTNGTVGDFYNMMSSNFFTPFVLQPTRLKSKTLIDNIYFNSLEYRSHSGNLLIELSDHLIQFLILEGFIKERTLPEINLFKRDFSHFNEREFEQEVLNKVNWEHVCNIKENNPDQSCENFLLTLNNYLDVYAPYRKVTKKEYKLSLKPWICNEILRKCKKRDGILQMISKENDLIKKAALLSDYKKLRNEITQEKVRGKGILHIFF